MTPQALRLIGTELNQIASSVARLEVYESERDHLRGHLRHRIDGEISTLRQSIEDDVISVARSLGLAVEKMPANEMIANNFITGHSDTVEYLLGELSWQLRDGGADYVLDRLAKALGLDQWQQVEGSEDWYTDVAATLWRVLTDAKVIDPETLERVTDVELTEYRRRAALNPLSGMSWSGHNVWGDEKSMAEVRSAIHSHSQVDEWRTLIRHQREEIGKLHAALRDIGSVDDDGFTSDGHERCVERANRIAGRTS